MESFYILNIIKMVKYVNKLKVAAKFFNEKLNKVLKVFFKDISKKFIK